MSAYADTLAAPVVHGSPLVGRLLLVASGVALVALCAQISIPLPFTPVPITGQTFAVLLVGSAVGGPLGGATLTSYILLGALGAPVFAEHESGTDVLTGPTGGYLLGFGLAALVTGMLAKLHWDRRFNTATAAMLAGTVVIYAAGLTWLAIDLDTGLERTLELGLYPFVVGDLLKLYLAALLLPTAWRIRDRLTPSETPPTDPLPSGSSQPPEGPLYPLFAHADLAGHSLLQRAVGYRTRRPARQTAILISRRWALGLAAALFVMLLLALYVGGMQTSA